MSQTAISKDALAATPTSTESSTIAGATRSFVAQSMRSLLRILPHVPAVKFFRPKIAKRAHTQVHAGGYMTRVLNTASPIAVNAMAGIALFTSYSLTVNTTHRMYAVRSEKTGSTEDPLEFSVDEPVLPVIIFSGILAGAIHASVNAPLTVLSTQWANHHQHQLQNPHTNQIRRTMQPDTRALIKHALRRQLPRDALGFCAFFSLYEACKRRFESACPADQKNDTKYFVPSVLASGVVAGTAYEALFYLDHQYATYWHRMKTHMSNKSSQRHLAFIRRYGLRGFAVHARQTVPTGALTFLAYELSLRYFLDEDL